MDSPVTGLQGLLPVTAVGVTGGGGSDPAEQAASRTSHLIATLLVDSYS
jgi:hypothetical protein